MNRLETPTPEQQQHSSAIHHLAEQYHLDEDLVRNVYERELRMFNTTEHVEKYLSLMATSHVRELIRQGIIDSI